MFTGRTKVSNIQKKPLHWTWPMCWLHLLFHFHWDVTRDRRRHVVLQIIGTAYSIFQSSRIPVGVQAFWMANLFAVLTGSQIWSARVAKRLYGPYRPAFGSKKEDWARMLFGRTTCTVRGLHTVQTERVHAICISINRPGVSLTIGAGCYRVWWNRWDGLSCSTKNMRCPGQDSRFSVGFWCRVCARMCALSMHQSHLVEQGGSFKAVHDCCSDRQPACQ